MEKIAAGIAGIGTCVPDKIVTNKDLENIVDTTDKWILARTGIRERRIAAAKETTSDLAVKAAENALLDAGLQATDVDLIIVATSTPDMVFPATASLVQERLGCRKIGAFDISVACTGFVTGLIVGAQFIASGSCHNVMVIGAETLSKIIDWEDRNTCVLFGDGAGAVLLRPSEPGTGILASCMGSDGSKADYLKVPAGGSLIPYSSFTPQDRLHYIHMNGREVFRFAVKILGEAANEVTSAAGLNQGQIDLFIPHQANIRIIEAAAKRLGLDMDRVVVNVERYGNTSAASIPLALDEALRQGRLHDGHNVVMVAFGGGLSWAAVALQWTSKFAPATAHVEQ